MSKVGRRSTHRKAATRPTLQALHLIDIENLAGGSSASAELVGEVMDAYRRSVHVGPADHVVVGTGPRLAPTALFAWPGARVLIGRGLDGADRALLAWAEDPTRIAERYVALYIASGDGIFTRLASHVRQQGLPTMVVSRREALSGSLRRSASRSLFLDDTVPLAA